ncbi:Bifunctional hemolysin/adenylate cyclase precursor [Octadecabacter ascidiaceicola]|uniref:Bifunctional hemolysin/adenylate cyclase n=2 Tax=Octadecabacter ascidiaceicola TaxID=1655543 RepID=A0A238JSN1_9RHOB|nr:Bifunctional hemolysin/adenylate cyclase precursor [Octadecabacter ascidiaceicola]
MPIVKWLFGAAMFASFSAHGAVSVFGGPIEDNPLVGITDAQILDTADGPMLFVTTRGDGWVTAFDLGNDAGDSVEVGAWAIDASYLQLETTDIAIRATGANTFELLLAGLDDNDLQGIALSPDGTTSPFDTATDWSASGMDAADISTIALWNGASNGLVALNDGGLAQLTFNANGSLSYQNISVPSTLSGAVATHIETTTHNGDTIALVSYGASDIVSLFRDDGSGDLIHQHDLTNDNGLWVNDPGAITFVNGIDGGLYVVVASSGSGTLSVLEVSTNGEEMRVVDHLFDTLDTRFEAASHVTTITMNGMDYVLAAGADDGISLYVMLSEGRLQHVETIAGSNDSPLNGITGIIATETTNGARIFVTTQGAPYLVEYEVTLNDTGQVRNGTGGNDTIAGQADDDVLLGGDGNDSLRGNNGEDTIMDGDGLDTMSGANGADLFILVKDEYTDIITDFDPSEDVIDLSALSLIGGLNNLQITSYTWGAELQFFDSVLDVHSADGTALGADDFTHLNVIVGNRMGVDPSLYDMSLYDPVPPTVLELPPTVLPGPAPDPLQRLGTPNMTPSSGSNVTNGTPAPDNITSYDANDTIFGLSGDDTIAAGSGHDQISGDGGGDILDGQGGNDHIFGGIGFDTLHGGSGNDVLFGEDHADTLYGDNGSDQLIGGAGYDWLFGGNGDDFLWAGTTADRLYGGDGDDYMDAGSNYGITVDGLWGGAGNDTMFGSAGYDLLVGGDGDDIMDGGHQADNVYGDDGNDTLYGDKGLDRLFGGTGNDLLSGGEGNDGHFGGDGNDIAWGGTGDDRFFGGSGNDMLLGEDGADTLYGGSGFDTIVGGADADILAGNFNADRFVFEDNHGHDIILDFDANNTLERIDFALVSQIANYADVLNAMTQIGSDVIIITGSNSSVLLENVDITLLDAGDFLF